ncbi:uncharacterized protein LOC132172417 [Corylus avellana]|uniref:uncharacterized protein LOC132172417 n=1 Tax=Corylus avellana TaxID=13451 RepID=UPI00286D5A33|nr:uncharacterized protein LOC132172417 [Corylus avellana]
MACSRYAPARTRLIDALSIGVPFSVDTRFPEDVKYVCVDKPPLFVQLVEVIRVLATPYKLLTEAAIKDYFSAIVLMREMIHNTKVDRDRIVFCRKTFEAEFHLFWESAFRHPTE